jgi:hypothetical protein
MVEGVDIFGTRWMIGIEGVGVEVLYDSQSSHNELKGIPLKLWICIMGLDQVKQRDTMVQMQNRGNLYAMSKFRTARQPTPNNNKKQFWKAYKSGANVASDIHQRRIPRDLKK